MWDITSCHFVYMNGNQLWKSEGVINFLCLRRWNVKILALCSVWNELESFFLNVVIDVGLEFLKQ